MMANSPKVNYLSFLSLLPALIQFAENIHGPKSGRQKLATVTTLAQSALLTAATAGVVSPEIANNVAAITDAVNQTLVGMKSSGELQPQQAVVQKAISIGDTLSETSPFIDSSSSNS